VAESLIQFTKKGAIPKGFPAITTASVQLLIFALISSEAVASREPAVVIRRTPRASIFPQPFGISLFSCSATDSTYGVDQFLTGPFL
jgi:hypothetical protein